MQTIIVDTTPGFRMPTINYSQGDIGRTFAIDLRSRFGDSLPASPTITIQATKPSGLGFSVASTSISGAVVTFTVTETMSNEAGRFPAELKIVKSGTTLFTANFYIECEASAHPEGTTDGDLDSISPKFMSVTTTTLPAGDSATYSYDPETNTATFGIPKGADGSLASQVLAADYSSSKTYAVGDYVYYNGNLYRCSTAITTAEAWTSGHWTQVALGDDVSDLKSDFNDLVDDVATVTVTGNLVNERNILNLTIDGAGNYSFSTTALGMKVPVEYGKRYGIFRINSSNQVIAFKPRIDICNSAGTVLTFVNASSNDITISDATASYMLMSSGIVLSDWQKAMVIPDYLGTTPSAYVPKVTTYTIDGLSECVVGTENTSVNILNPENLIEGYIDGSGNYVSSNTGWVAVMDVKPSTRYGLYRLNTSNQRIAWTPRVSILDADGNIVDVHISNASDFTTPSKASKMYIWNTGFSKYSYYSLECQAIENFNGTAPTKYYPYYKYTSADIISRSWWKGKNAVIYGDSITAQGNTDNSTGYFYGAEQIHQFGNVYYRGVGGQTFKANSYTFYANADGSYNSRDEGGNPPAGTTEHLGYFSSFDRITAMIPDDIRYTIDLVVVCGGTNDFASVEEVDADGTNDDTIPEWVVGDTTDAVWAASSYYLGGDYNLSTLAGAIASTLIKMQIWCPNALIVLATPFPRYEMDTHAQYVVNNVTFRQFCDVEIDVAEYMSAPVIDANAESNITIVNYTACTLDGTHPNEAGRELFGKAFTGELYRIFPKNR